MSESKNKEENKVIHTSEGNDIIFALVFGIVAMIVMAIVSRIIGS